MDLLGKVVTDLQSNVSVGENAITGELKYVTGYTGFSSNPAEQEGNYLVIHCESAEPDAVITVEVVGGYSGPVTLDDDGIIILRIANNMQAVRVTCYAGGAYKELTYGLTGITLDPEV